MDVLLRLDTSNLKVTQRGGSDNNTDIPLAWAKMYGKGRVFYASFAHDASTWDNADIQKMYFEAIKWALGISEGEVKPHPMRSGGSAPQ